MLNTILGSLSSGVAASTSSYESIATSNPTSGFSITFSSISSDYVALQLRSIIRSNSGSTGTARFLLSFNGDTNTANYRSHALNGDGSSATANDVSGQAGVFIANAVVPNGESASIFGVSIVDIYNYQSSTQNKTIRTISGGDLNGGGTITLQSGLYMDTTAITSITVNLANTSFQSGTQIALYGIKGA